MAVLLLWLLDASNNTAMEPYRAFIADKLPPDQHAKGFLTQSFFTGLGITLANVSLFVFQQTITGQTEAGIPYWVFGSFMVGAVCSIGTVLISVSTTPEIPPTEAELAHLRAQKTGFLAAVAEIGAAIKDMPKPLWQLALVYLFQWYAMFCYWQYVSLSIARSVWNAAADNKEAYSEAVAWTGLVNGFYNIVTFASAFLLVGLARRYGAKFVHSAALTMAAIGLFIFPHIGNKYLLFVPMIGFGIAWASMMGVPYIIAVAVIPKERYGVYMGIINMMIVIPMLIQTVTFGMVYDGFLGSDPGNAIIFAGGLLLAAALATLLIERPRGEYVENLPMPARVGGH
jgi:maltose/moltooligosaccharide transporter